MAEAMAEGARQRALVEMARKRGELAMAQRLARSAARLAKYRGPDGELLAVLFVQQRWRDYLDYLEEVAYGYGDI